MIKDDGLGEMTVSKINVQTVRGVILTPAGDKIPVKVNLRPSGRSAGYSHFGKVDIPTPWIDEFERKIARFHFWSEDGECFSQIQVLDEVDGRMGKPEKHGRIILMRDAEL